MSLSRRALLFSPAALLAVPAGDPPIDAFFQAFNEDAKNALQTLAATPWNSKATAYAAMLLEMVRVHAAVSRNAASNHSGRSIKPRAAT